MPTVRRTPQGIEKRALYARTNSDLMTHDPTGFPSDPEYGPVWWIGSDTPWDTLNGNGTASAIPAVTRATSLVVDPIAQSPMRVLEMGFGGKPLGRPRWLTDPMLLRPDERYTSDVHPAVLKLTRSKFWGDFLRSSLWHGVGAFIYIEDETGQPLAGTLRLIHPQMLTTDRAEDSTLRWVLGDETERLMADRDGYFRVGGVEYRICVLRNPHSPVDTEGRSKGVFELNPAAFRIADQISQYTSGTFRSGVPSGYLKSEAPGMNQQIADDLKAKWMAAHGGDRRSIAVLNSSTTFTPISMSPVDTALDAVKRLSIADVAFSFAIDPAMLSASMNTSMAYSNQRDYFRQHKDLGIGIWQAALEDTLSALLPGTQGVKVDLDSFTRPEPGERYAAYRTAIDAGILTRDEVRSMEGLPPLTEEESV